MRGKTLSPKELGLALGVSESSLKRWADEGLIRAARTTGGHRRITLTEAIRFVRDTQAPLIRPELLGLPDIESLSGDVPTHGEEGERLQKYLIEGHAATARGLVGYLYLAGWDVAAICDGPIRQALEAIGELWHRQANGVFLEHRATDIVLQSLHQLAGLVQVPGDAPAAVGGAISGDPHVIGSLMAATVLRGHGIEATNLGPNTPPEAFVQAADEVSAQLVWLSIGGRVRRKTLEALVDNLLVELANRGLSLIVGGREWGRLRGFERPNLYFGASMAELAAFARGIAAGAQAPKAKPGMNG